MANGGALTRDWFRPSDFDALDATPTRSVGNTPCRDGDCTRVVVVAIGLAVTSGFTHIDRLSIAARLVNHARPVGPRSHIGVVAQRGTVFVVDWRDTTAP